MAASRSAAAAPAVSSVRRAANSARRAALPQEPPPFVSVELREGCALEGDERPLEIYTPANPGPHARSIELLLTERRLCERRVDADGNIERRTIPLHRLLIIRLGEEHEQTSLVLRDLDFVATSLPLGVREDNAQRAFLAAIQAAWRKARAAVPRPRPPAKPFDLPRPETGPRHPEGPGRPRFDYAGRLARSGQLDAALYWLMEAALTEGVGVKRADAEPALGRVRRDARWPRVREFLVAAVEYWSFAPLHQDVLALPSRRAANSTLPVAVYLHGIGSHAELGERERQLADELGIAILAVDGTLPSGQGRFRWTENAELDLARVDAALAKHQAEFGAPEVPVLLLGFSQGGMAAGEIGLRFPERFAGLLLISPGFATELELDDIAPEPAHRRLVLRCDAAAGEAASTVKTTQRFCAAGERLGARTTLRLVAGATQHRIPDDFRAVFRSWSQAALVGREGMQQAVPSSGPPHRP